VSSSGEVLGTHSGVHNFTVGQRKGLGVATGSPLYVLEINGERRQVVVGGDEKLYSRSLHAKRVNWIAMEHPEAALRLGVKIRHRHEPATAMVEATGPDEAVVSFDQPQRAITPGQAAVFYDGDVVVGGGWIG
jgi:tRNA-specific 2-thiouridylase